MATGITCGGAGLGLERLEEEDEWPSVRLG
jgi:hypothetical protein